MDMKKHHLMMLGEIVQSFAINRSEVCLLCGDLNLTTLQNILVCLGNVKRSVLSG